MQKTKLSTFSKTDQNLTVQAAALILFARQDKEFAECLAAFVQKQTWFDCKADHAVEVSKHLVATDRVIAVRNANWLLQILSEGDHPQAQATLSAWAKHYESPKDVAIGIIGIMIMGPTLGIVEKTKKKKKAHLQIVIEKNFYESLSKAELVELCQKHSQEIIAKELRLAGGQVFKLHPDTAEWLLDEPATKIFVDTKENICELKKTLEIESLHYVSDVNNKIIAVSPSINDELVEDFGGELCK